MYVASSRESINTVIVSRQSDNFLPFCVCVCPRVSRSPSDFVCNCPRRDAIRGSTSLSVIHRDAVMRYFAVLRDSQVKTRCGALMFKLFLKSIQASERAWRVASSKQLEVEFEWSCVDWVTELTGVAFNPPPHLCLSLCELEGYRH